MNNLFTTHTVEHKNKSLELFIFGDVHRDTASCDVDRWKQFLDKTKKYDQSKCLYLGMGDYNDFASASEKKKLLSAGLHETTIDRFDRVAMNDIKQIASEMKHMTGKMCGIIGGNHTWQFANGKNSDEVMAELMHTKYLGWLSYIRIQLKADNKRKISFDIVACHGKAGGKLLGTSVNQVDELRRIFPMASLYVFGHDHKLSSTPAVVLYAHQRTSGGISIKQKEQRLCRSGSFKKTYTEDEQSYEISKLYNPSILGALHISVSMVRDRSTEKENTNIVMEAHV